MISYNCISNLSLDKRSSVYQFRSEKNTKRAFIKYESIIT